MSDRELDFLIGDLTRGYLDDEQIYDISDAIRAAGYVRIDGGTRTEWGARFPDNVNNHGTDEEAAYAEARDYLGELVKREVGPWVAAEDDAS